MAESNSCDISPVRSTSKHQITPHRNSRKTLRRDKTTSDVHASTSTPLHPSTSLNRTFDSPSSSFQLSQDNCQDVIWDYTSPKLPKGQRKKEMKLTIQELLDNLNQCQPKENKNKPSEYISLLENWMKKRNEEPVIKRTQKDKKPKEKSRQEVEKLKQFLESMQRPKLCKEEPINRGNASSETNLNRLNLETSQQTQQTSSFRGNASSEANSNFETSLQNTRQTSGFMGSEKNSKLPDLKTSFLNADSETDDEVWGDLDNSLIVKATQEVELSLQNNNPLNVEIASSIPETVIGYNELPSELKVRINAEKLNDILTQMSNDDWDTDSDDCDFLIDEMSNLPDEVLSGTAFSVCDQMKSCTVFSSSDFLTAKREPERKMPPSREGINIKNGADSSSDPVKIAEIPVFQENAENCDNNSESFNSFEDGSFDELLLCQPEFLTQIEAVESMMMSQPKCTPEEIRKKKDDALKRRTKKK